MIIFLHSIRYLRMSMIYWRLHRAVKAAVIRIIERAGLGRQCFDRPMGEPAVSLVPPLSGRYHCEDIDLARLRFSFLKDVEVLSSDPTVMRASVASKPLLWQFHFGYHDYLIAILNDPVEDSRIEAARTEAAHAEAALDFLTTWSRAFPLHAAGARRSAWHPYVLSIRIESWVRLHAMLIEAGIDQNDARLRRLAEGIERMTRVLLRNLERGTMANHLLRNIKALIFAGLYLGTATGAQARRIGLKLLDRELAEQILDDGCHFERSPMYHVSVLNDVLDMADAILLCGSTVPESLTAAVAHMTEFLEVMRHPDGEIPFFNDSTGSFFLRTDEVLQRGHALSMQAEAPAALPAALPVVNPTVITSSSDRLGRAERIEGPPSDLLPARVSGLLVARTPRAWLAMDAGLIGPDYQPGHAHCDTLSFELSLDGARFITDTGVYHYKESPERSYSRCTAAHNTVEIDGAEQSEVWKSFRVGRRAKIRSFGTEAREGVQLLHGTHDGYTRLQSGLLHERSMLLSADWLLIVDWLHGSGAHSYRSFLHFHPGVQLREDQTGVFTAAQGESRARLRVSGEGRGGILETEYYPAFGEKQLRQSFVFEGGGAFPRMLVTEIVFGASEPDIEIDGASLRVAGYGIVSHRSKL